MDEQTTAMIIQRLRRLSFDEVRSSIIQSMTSDPDPDLEIQRQTLSLRCPLSHTRIRDPCRFLGCNHFQCFDATSFLLFTHATQLHSESGTANLHCPICERNLSAEELVIDLYFNTILRRAPATADEIDLQSNGEWRPRDVQDARLREAALSVTSHSHAPPNPRESFGPPNARYNGGYLYPEPEVIVIDSTSSLHETITAANPENEKSNMRPQGEAQPSDSQPPAWGTHFRSTATAIYDSLPPLGVPLPFPFSLDFWNTNDPNTPQTTSSRVNLPGPGPSLIPSGSGIPEAFLARPPPAYQPQLTPRLSSLGSDPGTGSRPDNYDQRGQFGPPCLPPVQPDRGLNEQESTGGIFGLLRSIGFGWSLWMLMVLVDLIEGIITIRLSIMMTRHHDFSQLGLGNRIRFVCFTSWWTMTGLLASVPIHVAWTSVLPGKRGFLTALAAFHLTWIFWTAGAGSISDTIWPREGPDCIIENFPYCKYTQGVLGLAWLMWIMVTVQGAYLVCQAYKRYEAAQRV